MEPSNSRCLLPHDQGSRGTTPEIDESIEMRTDPGYRLTYLGILATATVLVGMAYT